MTHDECCIDQTVWANAGAYGWRAATITRLGTKWIHVSFRTGKGRRLSSQLRLRNPRLMGKDKPAAPLSSAEAQVRYE